MNSLVLCAAPFSPKNSSSDNANNIARPKNRTLKNRTYNNSKLHDIISKIHQSPDTDDDDVSHEELGDFNPPPPPSSVGVTRAKENEVSNVNTNLDNSKKNYGSGIIENGYEQTNEMHDDMYINNNEEYYKKNVPMHKEAPISVPQPHHVSDINYHKGEMTQKLNYMIHLLEEQQDEKTGHVFEELILYSFLGIFIIFVVDSFARAGKYVR